MPDLRRTLRMLFTNTDPRIAERARMARQTMNGYGYDQVNRICESRLELVPEKYRVDPHGRLRDFYEDFASRPPTDEEIHWADQHHRGYVHAQSAGCVCCPECF